MSDCCAAKEICGSCCDSQVAGVESVENRWAFSDHFGALRCRFDNRFRMNYSVPPGLYSVGDPDSQSPVMVTANYKMSFDLLRKNLRSSWILVLDTKGINVWCAAGNGTFGTEELMKGIVGERLDRVVDHRLLTVPQLGAPGISPSVIRKATGFKVRYGPVRAGDIGEYLRSKGSATTEMRKVSFSFADRIVLAPMEILSALRKMTLFLLFLSAILGLQTEGVLFESVIREGLGFILGGYLSVFLGAFLTPVLLPFIPGRSFALKGWILTFIPFLLWSLPLTPSPTSGILGTMALLVFYPIVGSYLALNFTGCSPIAGPSGVKREMKCAVPLYAAGSVVSAVFFLLHKLSIMGVL